MDNITHTITGLMMSRVGLNRFTPGATFVLLLAANAPDIDVVSGIWGAGAYLHYHRWITHSIAAIPVMAALPVLLVWLIRRKPMRFVAAYVLSLLGVASHLLLDWTNQYGIRLFLPWSGEWTGLDSTNVVDIWIWIVLALVVCGPAVSRLVSSEIGAKKPTGMASAVVGLLFLALYDGGRFLLHQRAVEVQEARIYDGVAPKRVSAVPTPFNPLKWQGIVDTGSAYHVSTIDLSREFDPTGAQTLYKAEHVPQMDIALRTRLFQDISHFTPYPYWRVAPSPEGANKDLVQLMDLRFGAPPRERFVANAVITPDKQVERTWFSF